MSTTGPMTRATRPTPGPEACSTAASVVVAVMFFSGFVGSAGERVGARHDLADLLRDLGLAGLVGEPGVHAHQVLRVLGGGVHRALTSGQLGCRRLEQAGVDAAADVPRKEGV